MRHIYNPGLQKLIAANALETYELGIDFSDQYERALAAGDVKEQELPVNVARDMLFKVKANIMSSAYGLPPAGYITEGRLEGYIVQKMQGVGWVLSQLDALPM
ncbi:MAG: hypothetical protein ABIJ34_05890 [archaeon]